MKIEEGFRPKSKKEHALDQAEIQDGTGLSRLDGERFSSKHKENLDQLIMELELISIELRDDHSKINAYLPELRLLSQDLQQLSDASDVPREVKQVSHDLMRGIAAAETGAFAPTLAELDGALEHLREVRDRKLT